MPLRRPRGPELPPSAVEAFRTTAGHVQRAKEVLMAAVPSPRGVPGTNLAEAVLGFESALAVAGRSMDGWRPVGEPWTRCRRALDEALARAERLRLEGPELDYEGLVSALGDLLDPLDAFEEAERIIESRR